MIIVALLILLIALGLVIYLQAPADRPRTARVGEILFAVALFALLFGPHLAAVFK